jgi:hypothetical protein
VGVFEGGVGPRAARLQVMFEPRLPERDERLGGGDRENRSPGEARQAYNLSQ